jgi:hypothetical protein
MDHLNDLFPDLHIIDAPGAIPLRRPDVDHGIEFNPVRAFELGIDVDPPQVLLLGPVLEKERFLVRMELAVDGQDLAIHIDHGLDQVPEAALSHGFQVCQKETGELMIFTPSL